MMKDLGLQPQVLFYLKTMIWARVGFDGFNVILLDSCSCRGRLVVSAVGHSM